MVRFTLPKHGEGRFTIAQYLLAETLGHSSVTLCIVRHIKAAVARNGVAARAEGAGSVIHVAVIVGVLKIGGAG